MSSENAKQVAMLEEHVGALDAEIGGRQAVLDNMASTIAAQASLRVKYNALVSRMAELEAEKADLQSHLEIALQSSALQKSWIERLEQDSCYSVPCPTVNEGSEAASVGPDNQDDGPQKELACSSTC